MSVYFLSVKNIFAEFIYQKGINDIQVVVRILFFRIRYCIGPSVAELSPFATNFFPLLAIGNPVNGCLSLMVFGGVILLLFNNISSRYSQIACFLTELMTFFYITQKISCTVVG